MSAASLTLGVIHLFVWFKQRSQYAHLLFFALAVSAAAFGAFELAMMQAQSPADYAATLRWAHVPLAMFVLSIVWFVHFYFDAGRLWLAYADLRLQAARARAEFRDRREHQLSRGFLAGPGDAVGRRRRFGAGRRRQSVGDRAPARQRAPCRVRRRCLRHALASRRSRCASPRGRRRRQSRRSALPPSRVSRRLITSGLVHAPTIVMPGVFIVVLAMGYELGWDVIAAAQLAAQLRASEQRFRAVVEAVPSAILLVDDKGMITLANAQAETVFGYQRAELIAKPVEMLIPERFRVPHVGLRRAYAKRRAGAGDGGRARAVRVPQGRQRNPGGSRAQSDADRGGIVRTGVGRRHHRAQERRAGNGPPARRARAPVAGRDAGRVVRIARARAQPAADGHPEQCAGGAALSRAQPAARRQARGNPRRHREERSPCRSGDSAATIAAEEGRGAASSARHQRRGRGIAASDAQ